MKYRVYDGKHHYVDSLEAAQAMARKKVQGMDVYGTEDDVGPQEIWKLNRQGEVFYHSVPKLAPGMRRSENVDVTKEVFTDPPKVGGVIDVIGWDIGSPWMIDGAGKIWFNGGGHGGDLHVSAAEPVISEFESNGDTEGANKFRKLVGVKIPPPAWIAQARAAKWIPPEGWVDPE